MSATSDLWDVLEETNETLREVNQLLLGPTLTSEELDDLTSAIAFCHEAITIAKKALGLPT